MNHLNVFNPYRNKSNNHEDELTRGFLILFQNIPMIQSVFLQLVREQMIENGSEKVINNYYEKEAQVQLVETQISNKNDLFNKTVGRRLVSIVISDDKYEKEVEVTKSDREARYDGVIIYDPNWIFVIENKPAVYNIWADQLKPNVTDDIEIEAKPVCLSWRDVIEVFSSLVEKKLIVGIEATLLEDFIEFVDNEYAWLNPYTSFSVCKNNKYLVTKRCNAIMDKMELGTVEYHKGWKHYISVDLPSAKQIALAPIFDSEDSWHISLDIYPGDSMSQARSFYKDLDVDFIGKLIEEGWIITPNFHFSFRASNLVWTKTTLSPIDYANYWKGNISNLKQVPREELIEYYNNLVDKGIASEDDLEQITNRIINTKMQKINICPGISFVYRWSREEAVQKDIGNKYINDVRNRINQLLDICK